MKKILLTIGCKKNLIESLFQSKLQKLFMEIEQDNLNKVKDILYKDKLEFNQYNEEGENPLHHAVNHEKY